MPPKRKASKPAMGEPAPKQRTRSTTLASVSGTRTTRATASKAAGTPVASTSTPKSPRKRLLASTAKGAGSGKNTLKENGSVAGVSDDSDSESSTDVLNFTSPQSKPAASSNRTSTRRRLVLDSVTVPHLSRPSTPTITDDNPFHVKRPVRTYSSANKHARQSHRLPTPAPTLSTAHSPTRATRRGHSGAATQPISPTKHKGGRYAATQAQASHASDSEDTLGPDPLSLRQYTSRHSSENPPRLPTLESPSKPRQTPTGKTAKGKAKAVAVQDDTSDADADLPRTPSKSDARKKFPATPFPSRLAFEVESLTPSTLQTPTSPRKRQDPVSPFKTPTRPRIWDSGAASPTKSSPSKTPGRKHKTLLPHFVPCLHEQKRAILGALQDPLTLSCNIAPERAAMGGHEEEKSVNCAALEQLQALLNGTVERGEGNSCMIIGPRGSGKTKILEHALRSLEEERCAKPTVIRLSGHAQHNDRLAMREIAWQLAQEVHSGAFDQFLGSTNDDGDNNEEQDDDMDVGLPPSAHLPALIGVLPTLKRPVVVVLDAFDLFALHPRQSLLYCLLDTAQASYGGSSWMGDSAAKDGDHETKNMDSEIRKARGGLAVVGITTRVDTLNLLEKRVKSRFSGRMIRTAGPTTKNQWLRVLEDVLTVQPTSAIETANNIRDEDESWEDVWAGAVEMFLMEKKTQAALGETYALTRDVNVLLRILTHMVLNLTPTNAFPTSDHLLSAIAAQRCPPRFSSLHTQPYPAICLLIAAVHIRTSGHDVMTFEMLHDLFKDQVRTSLSAPVMVEGGGIGMVKCKREVMAGAFECLVATRVFVPVAPPSAFVAKEFVKYRCVVDREEVKHAVERAGQTNLKKWLMKAGEVR